MDLVGAGLRSLAYSPPADRENGTPPHPFLSLSAQGWSANYLRLGPQTLITFLVAEQLRSFMGLGAL